jgi:shikimate kinase
MVIILIGFMGTGKSAVGRALSRRLSTRQIDTDHEIERRFGKPIPRIFAEDGETAFREAETGLLREMAAAEEPGARKPMVISTGGGTPLREENAALLRSIGSVVLLDAAPRVILERVAHNLPNRPLLASSPLPPLERIRQLLAERRPRYIAAANHIIDTSYSAKPDDVAGRIMKALQIDPPSKTSDKSNSDKH